MSEVKIISDDEVEVDGKRYEFVNNNQSCPKCDLNEKRCKGVNCSTSTASESWLMEHKDEDRNGIFKLKEINK